MYIPEAFAENAPHRLHAMLRKYPFATLITCPVDEATGVPAPFVTHLPLLLDPDRGARGTLRGHMARANPQWRHFRPGQEVLAVFQGPHALIPSHWYGDPEGNVPTWNYVAVHATGIPRILEEKDGVVALLRESLAVYQPEGPAGSLDPSSARFLQLVQGIVAFELEITRLEGKFKLSQNRSQEDQGRVYDGLMKRGRGHDRDVARMIGDERAGG